MRVMSPRLRLLAAFSFVPLCACTGITVDERDHGVLFPTFRLDCPLSKPPADAPDAVPRTELELQASGADDEADNVEYSWVETTLAFRWNVLHDPKVRIGLFGGIGYQHTD